MLVTTQAIVLHSLRYGEADLIVKCYTQAEGLKSYLVRGVLKSKRGKFKASLFQPLSLLDIEALHKTNRGLQSFKEVKITQPLASLHTHIYKSAMVMFLAELLKNAIQEEEQNLGLFSFIKEGILTLDKAEQFSNFHLWFSLQLTQYLGFYPDKQVEASYFNLLEGVFETSTKNTYCIANEGTELLATIIGLPFSAVQQKKLNAVQRNVFLELQMSYYELHLQGFYKPKSLAVLQQLF
ncbi:MAG: DNA repair protein RecO [Mesonia hippocampi]|uniref:DNA repair protein RecO n=1 Tax=Mesonia hippocampi TaxID=1628250 RepID=UPI003F97A079